MIPHFFYNYVFIPFCLIIPVYFYLYIVQSLYPENKITFKQKLLFVPFYIGLFFCVLYKLFVGLNFREEVLNFFYPIPNIIEFLAIVFNQIIYVIIFFKIKKFEKNNNAFTLDSFKIKLNWLKKIVFFLFGLTFIWLFLMLKTVLNENVTPNHRFRLASVSKSYTGIAIMKLIQDGQFTLESNVFGPGSILGNDYGTLPFNSNVLNMKVKHLLQHTSGSWGSATGGDVIDQNPNYTYKQLFDWILDTRPNPNTPGTTYDYTNVGYSLLGRIIEKKSGKSYINYIKEDILAPIGVTTTDIAGKTEAEQKPNEVKYYGQGNDAPFTYTIAFPRRDADGGLIATATDLLKLVTATDGFTTRPDILNQSTITSYTTPSSANSGYANGIGIWSAENLWYNYGSLPGTRTGFMRHNNGMCVALLLNSRADPSGNENPFVYAMQDLMLDFVKNGSYNWQNIDQF